MTVLEKFMKKALIQANKAKEIDEVPVGAIIVKEGKVIASAYNMIEKKKDATCHAEILAIKKACKKLGDWRLDDCELFVTLEPCAMCAGAIVNSRIKKVYFGAYENKSGCAISLYPILEDSGLNHQTSVEGGMLKEECSNLIREYFKSKRDKKK